jgi:hypothetical protein
MNHVGSRDNRSTETVGETLRSFYRTYGMPGEGPPDDFDFSMLDAFRVDRDDLEILRRALSDDGLRRKHLECRTLVEEVANAMTGEAILRELSDSGSAPNR